MYVYFLRCNKSISRIKQTFTYDTNVNSLSYSFEERVKLIPVEFYDGVCRPINIYVPPIGLPTWNPIELLVPNFIVISSILFSMLDVSQEKEKDRESERERERETDTYIYVYIYSNTECCVRNVVHRGTQNNSSSFFSFLLIFFSFVSLFFSSFYCSFLVLFVLFSISFVLA